MERSLPWNFNFSTVRSLQAKRECEDPPSNSYPSREQTKSTVQITVDFRLALYSRRNKQENHAAIAWLW